MLNLLRYCRKKSHCDGISVAWPAEILTVWSSSLSPLLLPDVVVLLRQGIEAFLLWHEYVTTLTSGGSAETVLGQQTATSVSVTGLVLAYVWTTTGKPDLGPHRAINHCVIWTECALCGSEPGKTNFTMWVTFIHQIKCSRQDFTSDST